MGSESFSNYLIIKTMLKLKIHKFTTITHVNEVITGIKTKPVVYVYLKGYINKLTDNLKYSLKYSVTTIVKQKWRRKSTK